MKIPKEVQFTIQQLKNKGYEAYIVGGCVRDILRDQKPQDWDVATNAKPKDIGRIFTKSYSDNKFGTVVVLTGSKEPSLKGIEVTPYRTEQEYSDKRHPDKVEWAETIDKDLSRRDFTVNAMAITFGKKLQAPNYKLQINYKHQITNYKQFKVIDLFDGQEDLKNKIIRAVGKPEERFSEDALRLMRAIRFATVLGEGWKIEPKTAAAIKKNAPWIQAISRERIRDELLKIILSERAAQGIELLRKMGLLRYIIPEIEEGYKVTQNKHHIYDVYEHCLRSLDYATKQNFSKEVRIASLLHDVGKPRTKRGEGLDATFYNHEIVGARMTAKILNRLKFPKEEKERIVKLVRYHLFYYNVGEVGESSVRRLVKNAGLENMEELIQLRMADRIGSGVPKAKPYKLRHLEYLIEKVSQDPISAKMLKVNGNEIIKALNIKPGPKVGQILNILLGVVMNDPSKNTHQFLEAKIKSLGRLPDSQLEKMSIEARKERRVIEIKKDEMTKKKYWVT